MYIVYIVHAVYTHIIKTIYQWKQEEGTSCAIQKFHANMISFK